MLEIFLIGALINLLVMSKLKPALSSKQSPIDKQKMSPEHFNKVKKREKPVVSGL